MGNETFNEPAKDMLYPCSIIFLFVGIMYFSTSYSEKNRMIRVNFEWPVLLALISIFIIVPLLILSFYVPAYILHVFLITSLT